MGNTTSNEEGDNNPKEGKTLTKFHFNGFLYVTENGLCERKLTVFIRNNFNSCLFNTAYICNRLYHVQRKRLVTLFNYHDKHTRKKKDKGNVRFIDCSSRFTKHMKRDFQNTNHKNGDIYTDLNIQLVLKKSRSPHIAEHEIKSAIKAIEGTSNSLSMKHVLYAEGSDWFSKMSTCYVYPVSRSLGETFNSLIRGVPTEYYDDEVMSNCLQRLATFQHYVFENVPSSVRLAKAGWYFTGRYKETKCFSCKTVYSSWTRFDDPLAIHRKLQPRCEFVIELEVQIKNSVESKACVSNGNDHATKSHNPSQNEENMSANTANTKYPELPRNDDITQSENMLPSTQFSVEGENENGKLKVTRSEENEHLNPRVQSQEILNKMSHKTIPGGYANLTPEVNMLQYQHKHINEQRYNGAYQCSFHTDEVTRNFSHLSVENGTRESLLSVDNVPSTIQVQSHVNGQQQLVRTYDRESQQKPNQQPSFDNRKMETIFLEMKHPNFQALPVRMSSFMSWPLHSKLSPRTMALAGFFYKGYSDVVACYWCGISIVDWEEGDDPYIEHVRWQPSCPYMIQTKGEAFILLVQKDTTIANNRRDIESKNVAEKEIPPVTPEVVTTQYDMLTNMGFSQSDIESAIRHLIDTTGNRHPGFEAILDILLQRNPTAEPIQIRSSSQSLIQDNQPSGFTQQAMYRENESRFENIEGKQDFSVEPSNNDDRLLCKICLDKQVGVTFAPCGHLTSCMECSQNLTHCPVCRKVIQQKIKCFIT